MAIKNKAIAFAFLKGAQRDRYGNLAFDLKSQYARESNQYPKNLNQALRLLTTYEKKKKDHNNNPSKQDKNDEDEEKAQDDTEDMAFVQNTSKKPPECFLCGDNHYISTCPYRNQFKKTRLNKQAKPPPNVANYMLINNNMCQEIDSESEDEDTTDLYNFSFTNIGVQPITITQQIVMSQNAKGKKINQYWVLLDSQSTISIFNNKKLLRNIRKCKPSERV